MKRQATVALFLLAILVVGRLWAKEPEKNNDSRELVVAQQDKTGPADKKKGKEKKEKEKEIPPVAAADLVPQEGQLEVTDRPLALEMLGDFPGFAILTTKPPTFVTLPNQTIITKKILANGRVILITTTVPGARVAVPGTGGTAVLPGVSGFKVADNMSPMPMDRVYFSANIFNDFLASTNNRLGTSVQNLNVYRESLGFEKTFLDRNGSVGLILPLNTLTAQSTIPGFNGTHTALGDLSVYGRYALYRDDTRNNWITGGVAVTAPTGPSNFAGLDVPSPVAHTTILQPFAAVLWNFGDFYFQAFSSVSAPADQNSAPNLWFNDVGIGYFLYRTADRSRLLTAVAPTFEAHVADPLNYRGPVTASNPFGAFDIVDLGLGLNVLFRGYSRLGIGVVTPVTGPKPFNTEALIQFRVRF